LEIKEQVLVIIKNIEFSEYLEERDECPECHEQSLIRHIQKDEKQKWAGRWYIEYCEEDCPYWDCGRLPKNYKPKSKEEYKRHPDNTVGWKKKRNKEDEETEERESK